MQVMWWIPSSLTARRLASVSSPRSDRRRRSCDGRDRDVVGHAQCQRDALAGLRAQVVRPLLSHFVVFEQAFTSVPSTCRPDSCGSGCGRSRTDVPARRLIRDLELRVHARDDYRLRDAAVAGSSSEPFAPEPQGIQAARGARHDRRQHIRRPRRLPAGQVTGLEVAVRDPRRCSRAPRRRPACTSTSSARRMRAEPERHV